ncbi:hypothetical protein [Phenylobacterium sp.]|jgi:hypothetical protein|uniref:hypothetical protein n=1 Tax=Phenylobacterium sp. TaxID=1871053 RepID=UPI002E344E99|nr:hypothetical protein [Phenylobacterium sp.]HEX2560070.1 hypothetical protein [Phenylobacterium sp.]
MRLIGLLAAAFSLTAGAALACPEHDDCGRVDHHRHRGWSQEERHYEGGYERHERYEHYGHRRPPCLETCGEISLPASFFYDAGGVGPIPDGGWVGGGGFVVVGAGAGAQASAFASARASAHASVQVRFRGGFKGHHKGHKGGKRH